MIRDLRFALRLIWTHRWFSAAIMVTLALGIGANTTVFTLVNAVLFKPLPFPGGERLITVLNQRLSQTNQMSISYPDFLQYRERASSFESLEAVAPESGVLSEQGNPPEHYRMARVSPGLFEMLHTQPVLGRGFRAADGDAGAQAVVLIGYGVWRDRYGSSPAILDRTVRVNEHPATIIGVMPAGFRFPNQEDLWMPLAPTEQLQEPDYRSLMLIGILKPGMTTTEAATDLGVIASRLEAQFPETNKGVGVNVETFHERFNGGPIRLVFLLMLAAVGFVLLIACANVANMMLGRALGRKREVSIRSALGASRWRIIRQLLTESVLLSSFGGLLGFSLAVFGVRAFDLAVADVGKPYWIDFSMNYVVFGYFSAVCIASGLLFGLAPALQTSRVDLYTGLKDGSRSAGSVRGSRLSGALVVFQFTLAVVLLAGAGLFMRGFLEHQSMNSWVPADSILTARLTLPEQKYSTPDDRMRFYEDLLPSVATLPGATGAALVSNPPGAGAGGRRIDREGAQAASDAERPSALVVQQSLGYFQLIDLPLLAGRDFDDRDGLPGREAAIVTRQFADRFWPEQQALGKRFRFHNDDQPGPWISVIGISSDIVQQANETNADPLLFLPLRQETPATMALLVRTAGSPSDLAPALRAAAQNLDQDLALYNVRTLHELEQQSRWYLVVFGTLFFVFALIALLMASVGIYAVMAQATARRTQEIGVRMALGAMPRDILRLVLARGMKQVTLGLALGMAAAYASTRLMGELLFRVSPTDPAVFATVPLLLVAVGLFACWLPAYRASSLHPTKSLRHE